MSCNGRSPHHRKGQSIGSPSNGCRSVSFSSLARLHFRGRPLASEIRLEINGKERLGSLVVNHI